MRPDTHRPSSDASAGASGDRPSRLERLASAFDYFAQVFQLVVGAALLVLLDAYFITQIRAGDRFYGQAWLTFALPLGVTIIWLTIAAVNVHQLWRDWRDWRAIGASRAIGAAPKLPDASLPRTPHPPSPAATHPPRQ